MATATLSPLLLDAAASRHGEPIRFNGEMFWIKVSSRDTNGKFAIWEASVPSGNGPPLHVHHREDEWFYVLRGTFVFELDGRQMTAKPGTSILAPRNVPHRFQNVGWGDGRLLGMVEPGGVDEFFREVADTLGGARPAPERMAPIAAKYGLELLGPPLALPAGLDAEVWRS
jgi:mannose-6-phosphate isomerase-like protein (cupin superfamily)